MIWINFLHFYQPANAEFYNIRKALDKSYWRLLRLLEEHPDLKMTFNVSGCLLERLEEAKEIAFLDRLKFSNNIALSEHQLKLSSLAEGHPDISFTHCYVDKFFSLLECHHRFARGAGFEFLTNHAVEQPPTIENLVQSAVQ